MSQSEADTPRERQIAAELKRMDCAEYGHIYVRSREKCERCGEPFPIIVVEEQLGPEAWSSPHFVGPTKPASGYDRNLPF